MVLMKQFCKIEAETAEPLSTVPCLQYVQPFLPLSEKCLFYLEVIAFQRQAILISYQVSESNKKSLLIELGKATEQNIEWGFFPPYKPNRSCATHNWKKIDIHYWRSVFPPTCAEKTGQVMERPLRSRKQLCRGERLPCSNAMRKPLKQPVSFPRVVETDDSSVGSLLQQA